MCGLSGVRYRIGGKDAGALREEALRMNAWLRHRGPDDAGTWVDERASVALAFSRLAIQDLSPEANQPMLSESGRLVILFNGEVYNTADLRHALGRDTASFRTHSDTEVLLAAIETLGLDAALRLVNGMFAVALWDRTTHTLSLARDRLGKKPLHYAVEPDGVGFASELKALLARGRPRPALSTAALEAYFSLTYIPAPHTILSGVFKVRPGHIVEIDGELRVRERAYWSLEEAFTRAAQAPRLGAGDVPSQTLALLEAAVQRRLVSDVPLGLLLSGGADSGLIAGILARRLQAPVRAFTIGLEDTDLDEADQARAVAHSLGLEHTVLRLPATEALGLVDEALQGVDEPFGDYSMVPTYFVCKLARPHATVLLTGDGGDELFGGYTRYLWAAGGRGLVARAYAHLRARRLRCSNAEVALEVYRRLMTTGRGHRPAPRPLLDELAGGLARLPALSVLQYLRYLDFRLYLPDDILTKLDRASMARSVELRSPFLDPVLVEHSWRLGDADLVSRGERKRVLNALFRQVVGPSLLQRKKHGFSLPIAAWLRGPLRPQVEAALGALDERNDFDFRSFGLRELWGRGDVLRAADAHRIWLAYAFWRWSRRFEGGMPAAPPAYGLISPEHVAGGDAPAKSPLLVTAR